MIEMQMEMERDRGRDREAEIEIKGGWAGRKGRRERRGEQFLIVGTVGKMLMGSVDGYVASILISLLGSL